MKRVIKLRLFFPGEENVFSIIKKKRKQRILSSFLPIIYSIHYLLLTMTNQSATQRYWNQLYGYLVYRDQVKTWEYKGITLARPLKFPKGLTLSPIKYQPTSQFTWLKMVVVTVSFLTIMSCTARLALKCSLFCQT